MIPDCYDPAEQEERIQAEADAVCSLLPCCTLCRRALYPGARIHTARYQIVCSLCLEELIENEDIVELD